MWRRLFPSSPDGMLRLHTQHSTLISIEHSRYIDWIIRRNVAWGPYRSSTAHPAAYIYTAARTPFPAVMMFCVDDMWRPIYTLCVCVSAVYDDILSLHFYFLLFFYFFEIFLFLWAAGELWWEKWSWAPAALLAILFFLSLSCPSKKI